MPPDNSGNGELAPPSSTQSLAPHPIALRESHLKAMIPVMQAVINTNRFHTEHEDYALWNAVITYIVEIYMARPASVVPQPKLWLLPEAVRSLLRRLKKQKKAPRLAVAPPQASTAPVASEFPETATLEDTNHDTQLAPPPRSTSVPPVDGTFPPKDDGHIDAILTAGSNALPLRETNEPIATIIRNGESLVDANRLILEGDLLDLDDLVLNRSTNTVLTDRTKGKKKVISDFGVVTPLQDNSITAEQLAATCAKLRRNALDEASRRPPDMEDLVPELQYDADDVDSEDDDYESDDSDDEDWDVPDDVRDATPAPFNVGLRPRTAPGQSANSTTSGAPLQPPRHNAANNGSGGTLPDWLASDIVSAGWWDSDQPFAQVCNHKSAFKKLRYLVQLAVAMIWEGKRSASRKLDEDAYRKKTYSRFYKGMRCVMIQALFVLTGGAWNQKKVVCVVMVSDFWSWNMFERIEEREVKENWQDYTTETAPIRSCFQWSPPVQWGSPESDEAVILMMNEVNLIFPAFAASTSESGSSDNDPAAATNPSEPSTQAHAQPNAGAAPSGTPVVAAHYAQASAPSGNATGQERTEVSVDDASLEHAKDRSSTSGPAPEMQRPPLTGAPAPSADVTMSDAALSSNAAAAAGPEATAPAPLSRAPWRGLQRNDTEDTEPDAPRRPLPVQANNPNDSGVSRSLLHGHRTMATLDALDSLDINANGAVGSSANALAGNGPVQAPAAVVSATAAQPSGSGNALTNTGNPRKRSASASSDGEDDDRAQVAKKAKRAPASTEPSAEAGPGPSTQASRSRAPSKGKKRKYNGAMAQAYAQVHPRNEKGHFVKKQ
ncbi:hypothetical protein EV714DRAFT_207341 [Schizophyllum commune]